MQVIQITTDVFNRQKNNNTLHEYSNIMKKQIDCLQNIYKTYDCFSESYRYTPNNNNNSGRVDKKILIKKPILVKSNLTDSTKKIIQLLNKLTDDNKDKICSKLLSISNVDNIDVFLMKMLDYSKESNMYSRLIMYMMQHLYHDDQYKKYVDYHINTFIDSFIDLCSCINHDYTNNNSGCDRDDKSDYDMFCLNVKIKKQKQYTIISILNIYKNTIINRNLTSNIDSLFDTILNSLQSVIERFFKFNELEDICLLETLIQFVNEILKCDNMVDTNEYKKKLIFVLSFDDCQLKIFPNKLRFKILDLCEYIGVL